MTNAVSNLLLISLNLEKEKPVFIQCSIVVVLKSFECIQDKAPYIAKAEKKKEEYEKTLRAYNNGLVITLFLIS